MPRVARGLAFACLCGALGVSAAPALDDVDDVPTIRLPSTSTASPASTAPPPAPPPAVESAAPCSGPAYHAFDFWVGAWRVYDAEGQHVGDNRIVVDQAGCLLIESWRSVRGVTGRSFSYYDAERARWRQTWISPGSRIELEGNLVGAHMVLEGSIHYLRTGEVRAFRGTWAPLPGGGLRQYLEESSAVGTWVPWFEGFYRSAPR